MVDDYWNWFAIAGGGILLFAIALKLKKQGCLGIAMGVLGLLALLFGLFGESCLSERARIGFTFNPVGALSDPTKENLDKLRRGLELGAWDLNDPDLTYDRTYLHQAAVAGDLEVVRLMVEAGADVNVRDMAGGTPAAYAATAGNHKLLSYLASHGADLTVPFKKNISPLHLMALFGSHHPDAARILVEAGVSPDSGDFEGRTPLHYACGALDVDGVDAQTLRVHRLRLFRAARFSLINGRVPSPRAGIGLPVHFARSAGGRPAVVEGLIGLGADPKKPDDKGRPPNCVVPEE